MHSVLLISGALAALTQPLPQDLADDVSFEAPVPPQEVLASARAQIEASILYDAPGDGRVWAVGQTYKASFGHDGFVYTPFLGSDAPRSFPISFDLEEVTVGGRTLDFDAEPAATVHGDVVTLQRGTVSEVYHLGLDSIEQTFVFDEIDAEGHDVVLRMDVTSDLAVRRDGAGFAFEGPHGSVRFGSATALDAGGRSTTLEQRLVPGGIEIVVPAEFAATAQLPLVVDPVLTTVMVRDDSRNYVDVDVAYDAQSGVYMIVYERVESFNDHDVIAVFYNTGAGVLTLPVSIDTTSDDWRGPRVASNYMEQTFLCVAQEGSIGGRSIVGRTRDAVSGNRGSQFTISPAGDDHSAPDVGGFTNDTLTSFDYTVVWQRATPFPTPDADIVAQGVSASSSLIGSLTVVSDGNSFQDLRPRISKGSGRTELLSFDHQYMIAWEREVAPNDRRIYARVIDYDLDLTGHDRFRAYDINVDARDVDVSTQDTSSLSAEPFYVLAFERLKGGDYEIYTVVATDGDNDNGNDLSLQMDLGQTTEQRDPRIAYDGEDYLIVFQSEDGLGGWDAYMTAANVVEDPNGELRTGLVERRTELRAPDGSVEDLAIASRWDSGAVITGGFESTAFALWTAEGSFGSDGDVSGAFVIENEAKIAGRQYCDANENVSGESAWMRVHGNQSASTDHRLYCQNLPENSFGYFIVGDGNAVTPFPGGSAGNLCISGAVGRYSNSVASSGPSGVLQLVIDPSALPQPNGTTAAQPGEEWYFQCWTRDSQGGTPTSNFSNGVRVTFLP
ncbi:MAG: hypothetical protein AAF726_18150 [Planctomycetota bacterium]